MIAPAQPYHGRLGHRYMIATIVDGVLVGHTHRQTEAEIDAAAARIRARRPAAKLVVKTLCNYSGDVLAERLAA